MPENASCPKRERMARMRSFADLLSLGYVGGSDAVRRYSAQWRKERELDSVSDAQVPQSFVPGKAYRFDWSREDVVLGGKSA